jgi:Lon protease-like protein
MEQGNRILPLFPLSAVLFPDAAMPLRIFEDRYKLMVQRCLESDSEFGVVLIKSGFEVGGPAETYSVGTVARIFDVERRDDGTTRIAVAGRERFRIESITQQLPYLEGQVTLLEEDPGAALSQDELESVRSAASSQVRLVHGLNGGWLREPKLHDDPVALSYFIAVLLQVKGDENQAVLEESTTADRLRLELSLLKRDRSGLEARVAEKLGGEPG